MHAFLRIAALGLLTLLPLATLAGPQPTVLAVFPPWWTPGQSIAAASEAGPVLGSGAWPFLVIVDHADATRLRAAGALLVLPGSAAGWCG